MSGAGTSKARQRGSEPAPRERARADPKPSLEVVPIRRRLFRLGMAATCVLAVVVLFGLVGFNALIVDSQARIDSLDARLAELTDENHKLQFTIAQLESPEHIRTVALEQLGMIEPYQITYLEPISRTQLHTVPASPDTGQ